MTHAKPDSPQDPTTPAATPVSGASRALARAASLLRRAAVALLIAPLRVYQYAISPMLPPRCRYLPTCSSYAVEALRRHGPLSGGWLALTRVCRCHPFADGGIDPVPETFSLTTRAGRWPAALRGDPPARTD